RVVRRYLERITLVIPVAVVVARTVAVVEEAVELAGAAGSAWQIRVQVIFGVVADARAVLVGGVDLAVRVVVDAVAALVELASTGRNRAEVAASTLRRAAGLAARTQRIVRLGDAT